MGEAWDVDKPLRKDEERRAALDKRKRTWRSPEVLALLDEFAALGGR